MSVIYLIYLITNIVNGKQYVGQTKRTLKQRWSGHICDAITCGKGGRLNNAIRKHGKYNFIMETIVECSEDVVDDYEIMFIDLYETQKKGYNIERGGVASGKSHGTSRDARLLISKSKKRNSELEMGISRVTGKYGNTIYNGYRVRTPDTKEEVFMSTKYSDEENLKAARLYLENKQIPDWYIKRCYETGLPQHVGKCINSVGNRGYQVVYKIQGKRHKKMFTDSKHTQEQLLEMATKYAHELTHGRNPLLAPRKPYTEFITTLYDL
jgi:group I intron endonuclease